MKVEFKETGFRPMVITLETLDEVEAFYLVGNVYPALIDLVEKHTCSYEITSRRKNIINTTFGKMWDAFKAHDVKLRYDDAN